MGPSTILTTPPGFDAAFAFVVGVEGVYSDDANDKGNWTGGQVGVGILKGTKYGISAASFPRLDIVNLTLNQAKTLYLVHYWAPLQATHLPVSIAAVCFDAAVNHGVHTAVIMLQQALHVTADGLVGPITLHAAQTADEHATVLEIGARRAFAYAGDAQIATDGLGWMRRLLKLLFQFAPRGPAS